MDTLEAFIILQDASIYFQKNEMTFVKAKQNIENYLWFDEVPVALQFNTKPEKFDDSIFQINIDVTVPDLVVNHPSILASVNKQSYFEIAQKLKREKLKPKLKVKYNPLLSTSDNSILPNYSTSDFKWGFDFSMPLFLRSERAAIQKGEIKLQEIKLDIKNKRNKLQNKLEGSLEQQLILREQLNFIKSKRGRI